MHASSGRDSRVIERAIATADCCAAKCTSCDGTGGSGDKPAGSLLQPGFLLPKSLNPRLGRRVFYASRQCFVPRAGTKQNSGGTKPFFAPAKTSGNRRQIPIDHQMKGRKGP
jgi:hypothetical protein